MSESDDPPERADASAGEPEPARADPGRRRTFAIVFLTIFLDLVGFGIIIPIQPFYAETFGASATVVTLLGASYSFAQFIMLPFWGRLSDRVGRRPVLLVSIAVAAVGYLLFGLAGSLGMLFAARVLSGIGTANIGTAQAIIADLTDSRGRAGGMALIGIAFGLGFIVGPALGGIFGQFGIAVPAFVAAGLSASNLVLASILVPETHPPDRRGQGRTPARGLSIARLRAALKLRDVPQLLALYLVVTTGFALMEQALPLFVEARWLPVPAAEIADPVQAEAAAQQAAGLTTWVLVVVGVTAVIVQGGLVGRLARRFGERPLLRVGLVLEAVSLGALPFIGWTGSFPLLLLGAVVMATGSGLYNPSLSALLSLSAPDDEQGGILGLGQSMSALGRVIGPAVAGLLFELVVGLPFWIAAVLMGIMVLVSITLRGPHV